MEDLLKGIDFMIQAVTSRLSRQCLWACALAITSLGVTASAQADPYAPQPMQPPAVDHTYQSGRTDGMTLFPASPIPGQPGVDPSKDRKRFLQNQWVPYPGSVEHYRVFNYRIHPVPLYNHRTLVKNFPAGELGGVTAQMKETFAEPVEYLRRYGARQYTGEFRDPVPVVRLKPGQRLTFKLGSLPTSMYAVRMIGAIEPDQVTKDPKGLVIDMRINDGKQGEVSHYALRQRAADNFFSLGEFHFHVEDARQWEVTIGLHEDSEVDLLVHNVDVHDVLNELARRAGKTRSIGAPPYVLEANWARDVAKRTRANREALIQRQVAELKKEFPDLSDEQLRKLRRERMDDALWNALPPSNAGYISRYTNTVISRMPSFPFDRFKPDPATAQKLAEAGHNSESHWRLDAPERGNDPVTPWRMVWEKPNGEKLYYTLDDLKAQKPLPGLPVEIRPWGIRTEDEEKQAYHYFPIMNAVGSAFDRVHGLLKGANAYQSYVEHGELDTAHSRALLMVRVAYELPNYHITKAINTVVAPENLLFNRTNLVHYRDRPFYQQLEYDDIATAYDRLFPFIQGNQELADAVGRYIKWVKTPEDVIALLDTYLLQYGVRQAMYMQFYYNQEQPALLAKYAAYQANGPIATPWVKHAFEWTWEYPHPYAGAEDYMYLSTQRDGTHTQGSIGYSTKGSAVARMIPFLREYIADGGDKRYDLSDVKRFPRLAQFPGWLIESRIAGMHGLQIGDVGGQNIPYAQWNPHRLTEFNNGFELTGDPRFAWIVSQFGKRTNETDAQWEALQEAAKKITRNPFLDNQSRVLADWGSILEGNFPADDFRLRSAARLRIGVGYGHAHSDSLDLGLWALGLNMSGDMGGRSGYNYPSGLISRSHNMVSIDNQNWMGHAWTRHLSNFDTVQYTHVDTLRGGHYSRQIALVEVDRGQPSPDFPAGSNLDPYAPMGKGIVNARSYLVDFARTRGGKQHWYNFHGPQEDEFTTNLQQQQPGEEDVELLKGYLMPGQQWVATVDQPTVTATWRVRRESVEMEVPGRGKYQLYPTEQRVLGKANYDAESPRKFLRVHLPGQEGLRVLSGVNVQAANKARNGEWFRRLHVMRPAAQEGKAADSLFAAVWEPYAGESFITSVKLEGDVANHASHAAVYVTTKQGHNDVTFSDVIKPELRTLENGMKVHAGFAFVSQDDKGLRHIAITAGRELHTPALSIAIQAPYHQAKVTKLDYYNNIATLDQPLPASLAGRFFEVGTGKKGASQPRWSNFEVTAIEGNRLTWRKGADAGTGVIRSVHFWEDAVAPLEDDEDEASPADSPYNPNATLDPASQETSAATQPATTQPAAATTPAKPEVPDLWKRFRATKDQAIVQLRLSTGTVHGRNHQLALTTQNPEAGFARANVSGRNMLVDAAELRKLDVKPGDRIRLFEIAEEDIFRTPSQVDVRRVDDKTYAITADVPMSITVASAGARTSTDGGKTWQALSGKTWQISADQLSKGGLQLRLQ